MPSLGDSLLLTHSAPHCSRRPLPASTERWTTLLLAWITYLGYYWWLLIRSGPLYNPWKIIHGGEKEWAKIALTDNWERDRTLLEEEKFYHSVYEFYVVTSFVMTAQQLTRWGKTRYADTRLPVYFCKLILHLSMEPDTPSLSVESSIFLPPKFTYKTKPTYKYCIVPMCKNTTVSTPNKIFFNVPRTSEIRRKWCEIIGREETQLSESTSLYCCEDHFNVSSKSF